jgi:thiol-disulfide isomerase/thioredoxin
MIGASHRAGVARLALIAGGWLLVACGGSPAQPEVAETAPAAPAAPAPAAATPAAAPPAVARIEPGAIFPSGTYANLNRSGRPSVDLAEDLGKRAVVLYYWIAGNEPAERMFHELERLVAELPAGGIALYGVAVPRPGIIEAETIRARVAALGLRSPVLADEGYRLGQMLGVERVPSVSIVDRTGRLRLTNGGSLVHEVAAGTDVAAAIRTAAAAESLATYGALGPYFPVKELEGQPCPDFRAPLLANQVEQRWHSLLDEAKLNVLVFWSVDCPHCRRTLPVINEWLRRHPEDVNLVTAAKAQNEATRARTRQFCEVNDFVFPTLVDEGTIGKLYRVTTIPTILIIGPDGVVDTAIVTDPEDFGETIERKRQELLRAS